MENESKISYNYIPITEVSVDAATEAVNNLEELRANAYGYKKAEDISPLNYYSCQLLRGNLISFVAFYQGKMAGAIYVSKIGDDLSVDDVFVAPDYQKSGLHLGKQMIQYVIDNKELVEEILECSFEGSIISPSNDASKEMSHSLGYSKRANDAYGYYYRKI